MIAVRDLRLKEQETLQRRYLAYKWKEGDEAFVPSTGRNHFLLTTVPAFFSRPIYELLCGSL